MTSVLSEHALTPEHVVEPPRSFHAMEAGGPVADRRWRSYRSNGYQ